MDFHDKDRLAPYRAAAREWIAVNLRPECAEEARLNGHYHSQTLYAKLAADGILGAGWPAEYGGSTVDPKFAETVFDELALVGQRSLGWSNTRMVINTILKAGSEAEKLEGALGELMVQQLYIEWGLKTVEGLEIDGEPATPAALIARGPEELAVEVASCVVRECGLTEDDRKNF